MIRKSLIVLGSAIALLAGGSALKANAQSFSFTYVGGPWSVHIHSGWHRYWGGTAVGFYYAPKPVYIVPGYTTATYYTGPTYWRAHRDVYRAAYAHHGHHATVSQHSWNRGGGNGHGDHANNSRSDHGGGHNGHGDHSDHHDNH